MVLGEDAEAKERVVVEGAAQLMVTDQLVGRTPPPHHSRDVCLASSQRVRLAPVAGGAAWCDRRLLQPAHAAQP